MKTTSFRLSFPLLGLLVLIIAIAIGCGQVSGRAKAPPAGKAASGDAAASKSPEKMSTKFRGTVTQIIHAARYAYVQVNTGKERVWVAVPSFDGKVGDAVLVPPGVPAADFQSKTLNREFDIIYFVAEIRILSRHR